RALGEVREQGREIRRRCDLLPTCRQLFGRHHARTPSSAQRTGRTVAPAARPAAMAGAGSSPVTKNIEPPAPAPAAFPPSAPPAGVAQYRATREGRRERRVEGDGLDPDVGIAEGEPLKTTEGRGELILLAAGDLRLDGLEIPRLLRDLAGGHLLRAGQGQGGDERYIHGAGAAESRSRRRVAARRD